MNKNELKFNKIITNLKKTVKLSLCGENSKNLFHEKYEPLGFEIIDENEKRIIISKLVYSDVKYEILIQALIKTKYSIDDELAILRQRDLKPNDFNEYNSFVEMCKTKAKDFIIEREQLK